MHRAEQAESAVARRRHRSIGRRRAIALLGLGLAALSLPPISTGADATATAAAARAAHPQAAATPRRVLIVMDERPAMEVLAAYLKDTGGIESTIVDQKTAPEDWSGFDAVIGYVHGALQEPIELKIIGYTKQGGRYVCLHHSVSSGKAKNRYYFDFLGVALPGAEKSREPTQPGDHYAWRDPVAQTIVNLRPSHYITRTGLTWPETVSYTASDTPGGPKDYPAFTLKETEAYMNVQFTDGAAKTRLLGFRYLDDRNGALFMQDRAGWLKPAGRGWIVYLQMGHFVQEFRHPMVAQLVLNAVTWTPGSQEPMLN